jgi:general secretion pathway protein I
VRGRRGFTLLEMIVATTVLGIAVSGLMAAISATTRNAARLRDYDRAVQLGRLRMNDLLADMAAPRNSPFGGPFDPRVTGGVEAGWRAVVTLADVPTSPVFNDFALDRVQLEVWWMSGGQRRTFQLESYRRRQAKQEDLEEGKGLNK